MRMKWLAWVLGNQLAAELQAPVMFGAWALDSGDMPRAWIALRRTRAISGGQGPRGFLKYFKPRPKDLYTSHPRLSLIREIKSQATNPINAQV